MTTHTLKAADLSWILGATLPHVETTRTLPTLHGVLIETSTHTFEITATDRYTMAHGVLLDEHADAGGTAECLLPYEYAKQLLSVARAHRGTIDLDVTDKGLTIRPQSQSAGADGATYIFPSRDAIFPKWRKIVNQNIAAAAKAETENTSAVGVNSNFLPRWKFGSVSPSRPTVMTVRSNSAAVLFRSGRPDEPRYFVGLQTPVTLTDFAVDADKWTTWATEEVAV